MPTKEVLSQLLERNSFWHEPYQIAHLKEEFEKTLDIFIDSNYPNGLEGNTLMCSIHDSFPSRHNCTACNLQDNIRLIERFLLQYESINDVSYSCTTFILLLYLFVERINEYFSIIQIPEKYRLKHFSVFQEIKHWANFLKHPKSFMLVTHPEWAYKDMPYEKNDINQNKRKKEIRIDSEFVEMYYAGSNNNKKLSHTLAKKDNVLVVFPNPVKLMERFSQAQQKFASIIAENEMVREMLESETMITEHFITKADTTQLEEN